VAGLKWSARIEWLQRQRPMWREHDAKLAAAWRRDEASGIELDNVIVLPDRSIVEESQDS
jgi:hypothetical protein